MDLLSLIAAFWRHKLVTIPVILLTLLGAYYELAVKPPVYQAMSSFLLSNPPSPPTAGQIAADPALRRISPNNPYTTYGNLSIAGAVVVELVTSPSVQTRLVAAGADPKYQIAPNSQFGFTAPIIQITGVGPTPGEAILTADLVTAQAVKELYLIQQKQGVNPYYMIKALPVQGPPKTAQLSASGKLRSLIAVLGLGAVMLFVAVSAAEAVAKRRGKMTTEQDPRVERRSRDEFEPRAGSRPRRTWAKR